MNWSNVGLNYANAGFNVGIIVTCTLIITGVIILFLNRNKEKKRKWAWWLIIFGLCALISAAINYNLLFG
jgi:hypothetical protein